MDCDKRSPSRRYDFKYASNDALNTKRRYQHVQSKVKVYIENMRKEDQERRRVNITRHRSEPSVAPNAGWSGSDQLNQTSTNWKLVLEKKNVEFDEMKTRLHEMKTYGDTMNELLNSERLRRIELQRKLDAIRENLKIVNSCTWSDPGFRGGDRIAESDKIDSIGATTATGDVDMYIEDEVFRNSIEWLRKVGSDEAMADENDETILLQQVEVTAKKGMKYRVKKILRCCAPCIKTEEVV